MAVVVGALAFLFVFFAIGYVALCAFSRSDSDRIIEDGRERMIEDNTEAFRTSISMRRTANEWRRNSA